MYCYMTALFLELDTLPTAMTTHEVSVRFDPSQKCLNTACRFPLLTVLQPSFGSRSPSTEHRTIAHARLSTIAQLPPPSTLELPIALGNYLGRLNHHRLPSEQ